MNKIKVKATKKEYEAFDKWMRETAEKLSEEDKEYLEFLRKSMKRRFYGKKKNTQGG